MITFCKQHRRYEKYRDSGVEWLGEIPEKWLTLRSKSILQSHTGGVWGEEPHEDENDILCVRVADFDYGKLEVSESTETMRSVEVRQREQKKLLNGDILLEKSGGGEKQLVGRAVEFKLKRPSVCSNFIERLELKKNMDSRFTIYLLNVMYTGRLTNRSIKQTTGIQNLDLSSFFNEQVPLPEISTQSSIASYLDEKCALIDSIIAKKQRQIDLLKEKHAAIINQAVTRGLDEDVEMKESGVEWMGKVPKDWRVIQIKRLMQRIDYGISESLSGEGKIKVLTMGNIQGGLVDIPASGCVNHVESMLLLENNDLLFNRTNSFDLVGKVGLYRNENSERVTFASYLVRLRVNEKSDPRFLNYLLNNPQILTYVRGLALRSVNQANLNPTRYGQLRICIPIIKEQIRIADFIDSATEKPDALIKKIDEAISLLSEYKTSLISHAVTGRIRVS